MDGFGITYSKFTVLFEAPFWIGVAERYENGTLSVAKVTFGAEPKDSELYEWVLKQYNTLRFSPAVEAVVKEEKKNPKRIQRDVRKQLQETGIGTKSQQALKLQQERCKTERKLKSKEQKRSEIDRQYELRQQKKREKHKGH